MALKVIKTIPSVFTFCEDYLLYVEVIYYNRLQRNIFSLNIQFHKTRALKVIKTIPSVFTFCEDYLLYVEELNYNGLQWNSSPSIFFFIRQGILKLLNLSLVFSHFVRFFSSMFSFTKGSLYHNKLHGRVFFSIFIGQGLLKLFKLFPVFSHAVRFISSMLSFTKGSLQQWNSFFYQFS